MGGVFSSGENNDDLVNILKIHKYICSKQVERVFRAVDRGDYILPAHRDMAYKDMSCKVGNIHLSAPCVYCSVMEGLSLRPGLSFLNIGSGTGYLSTMAGLILGENGTNHGIEMHEDCLTYAYEHLEEFKRKSLDVDAFEFCEPVFQLGNFLNAIPNRQYDRVYCGAACPEAYEKFVKQFVKIGGILVMPYKDNLLKIRRTGEKTWTNYTILPVSFSSLMPPQDGADRGEVQLPLWKPRSLQELCRGSIRTHLRKMVWSENTNLEEKLPIKIHPMKLSSSESCSELGIPFIGDQDDAYEREAMATTLQLVLGSSMRALYTESPGGAIYVEQRNADTSSDSEDGLELEIERLSAIRSYPGRDLTKETSDSEAPTVEESRDNSRRRIDEDDNDEMDTTNVDTENYENTKEIENPEMRKDANARDVNAVQCGSNCAKAPSDSSAKRKRTNGECVDSSDDDSSDEPNKTASVVSDSDDADMNLNRLMLIRKIYSMMHTGMESSDSDSSETSSSDEDDEIGRHVGTRSFMKKFKNPNRAATPIVDGETARNDATSGASNFSRSSDDSRLVRCRSEEIGAKKRVLPSYENDTNDESAVRGPTKRINAGNSDERNPRSDTSSDDETDVRTNYRRAGQKRRSERKIVASACSSSSSSSCCKNGATNCSKKSYRSASSSSVGGPKTRNVSDEKVSQTKKKRSDMNGEASTSAENSVNTVWSDSDCETNFEARNAKKTQVFAHTIRKDLLSCFMKRKIHLLPLPAPLRYYINYNRDL